MSRSAGDPATTDRLEVHADAAGTSASALIDDRYLVGDALGRGGMGVVHRALDIKLGRPVAVKVLSGGEPADEERFAREVRTLALLAHPHLVRLLDVGSLDGRPCLVMALAGVLASGPLAPSETSRIGEAMASALSYVHGEGIVHRDVKPANILFDRHGQPRLADFGVARLVGAAGPTVSGYTLGTPAYLAPEQVIGSAVTAAADVYALGLVLLECLTGHRAFDGTAAEITAARLQRDPPIPLAVGVQWTQLLASLTAREPADRPTAADAVQLLRAIDGGSWLATRAGPLPVSGSATRDADTAVANHAVGAAAADAVAGAAIADAVAGGAIAAGAAGGAIAAGAAGGAIPVSDLAYRPTVRLGPSRGALGAPADPFASPGAGAGAAPPTSRRRSRAIGVTVGAVALLAAAGAGIAAGLAGSGTAGPRRGGPSVPTTAAHVIGSARSATTVVSAPTAPTSTTTTTTTTTTVPSALSGAGAAFSSALRAGIADGGVTPVAASVLASGLRSVLASPTGQPATEVAAFETLVQTYDAAVAHGDIAGPSNITALGAALGEIAAALGTAAPTPGPVGPGAGPPGQDNGHGHGHGPGHGSDG